MTLTYCVCGVWKSSRISINTVTSLKTGSQHTNAASALVRISVLPLSVGGKGVAALQATVKVKLVLTILEKEVHVRKC